METTHNVSIKLKQGIVIEFDACQIDCQNNRAISYSRIDDTIGQLISDLGMLYIDLSANYIVFNYDIFSIESTIEKITKNNNCTLYECNCESSVIQISLTKK